MLKIVMLCVSLSVLAIPSWSRDLVIAFDDTLQPSSSLDALARSQMLVRNLANAGVPQAMFLIQTRGLDAKAKRRLSVYSDSGHLLVNTGQGHGLETKADLYVYEIGLLKANRLLARYKGYKRHVHFSYLNEFGDPVLQTGLKQFLKNRRFKPTYVGTNPLRGADTYLDQLYQQRVSKNRPVDIVAMEKLYVDFVERMLAAQNDEAFLMLGYSPPQVLVLQENDLAAYFIAAVVERLQAQGWTFVSPESVFNNPLLNPFSKGGYDGNGYMSSITGLPDARTAYPRLLGNRKQFMDNLIQQQMPQLLQ